jgi:hypothetical protein
MNGARIDARQEFTSRDHEDLQRLDATARPKRRAIDAQLQACNHLPEKLWLNFAGLAPDLRDSRSAAPT